MKELSKKEFTKMIIEHSRWLQSSNQGKQVYFDSIQYTNENISNSNLKNAMFNCCHFDNCTFNRVNFSKCFVYSSTFTNCTFDDCIFTMMDEFDVQLRNCTVVNSFINKNKLEHNFYTNCKVKNNIVFNYNYKNCKIDKETEQAFNNDVKNGVSIQFFDEAIILINIIYDLYKSDSNDELE